MKEKLYSIIWLLVGVSAIAILLFAFSFKAQAAEQYEIFVNVNPFTGVVENWSPSTSVWVSDYGFYQDVCGDGNARAFGNPNFRAYSGKYPAIDYTIGTFNSGTCYPEWLTLSNMVEWWGPQGDGDYWVEIFAGTESGNSVFFQLYKEDDLWSSEQPSPTPVNPYAEVINYVPDTNISITLGTTTVGATFSVPNGTNVLGVGYRLISPNNTVVQVASTTVSTSTTSYTVSFDYDFQTSGYWQGRAFFIQDLGDGNVWQVDNPTGQSIGVDYTALTINPDGTITWDFGSTTSTTTETGLTTTCNIFGFFSPLCNLFFYLFIPKQNPVSYFNSMFSVVAAVPPVSSLVEAKELLDSVFRNRSGEFADTGLVLQFYGVDTSVISASSSNMVGLGPTQRTFMRNIISAGLWVLLATFLFWRGRDFIFAHIGRK